MLDFLLSALTWVEIILGLGLLIFIHEAGHFLLAKRNGVRVEAFSLGMGPILWRRTWGETEYRISAIPLGGYVKMSGENIGDERTGAPHELSSKSAWARLQIFAAGALMNLVIAFPIAIAAFLAGMYVHPPVIAQPSLPDAAAGIIPGDKVVSVNEKRIQSLDEYRKEFVTLRKGTPVAVKVMRGDEEMAFTVETAGSERHGTRPPSTTIGRITPGSPAALMELKDYDEIIKIDGKPVFHAPVVREMLQERAGKSVSLLVRNRDEPGSPERMVNLVLPGTPQTRLPADLHLLEAVIKEAVPDHSAADVGLRAGDRIRKVEGVEIRSYYDLKEALATHAGRKVTLEVERGGKIEKLPQLLVGFNEAGKGQLGAIMAKTTRIADVVKGSHYDTWGLMPGDVLLKIGTKHGEISVHEFADGRPGPLEIEVQRGPDKVTLTLKGVEEILPDFEAAGFEVVGENKTQLALGFNFFERRWTFGEAVSDGLREPIVIIDMTVKVLQKLFVREERASGLAGPVGIFKASHMHARLSLGNFLWLLILITVNLGIVNLLPIPVLDGGHILLLAIEKVRGAPPSPKFVERFQLVGLIFLLGLLIFVTMNDFRNIL